MSNEPQQHDELSVHDVIDQARRHLNRGVWRRSLLSATLICGSIALVCAVTFTMSGHRVPIWLYPLSITVTLAGAAIRYWRNAYQDDTAAAYIDRHFGLMDAVTAHNAFERSGKHDGFFALQHQWTVQHLRGLDISSINISLCNRRVTFAALLLLVFFGLSLVPDSPSVLARQERESQTLQLSEEMKEDLQQHIEEMIQGADQDEQEFLNPDELREWVDQLNDTRDLEDMLRQYANLEQQVAKSSAKLDQRDTEQLLADTARRLGQSAETAQLGQKLKQKSYRDAAKELDKLRPDASQKLKKHREQLSRLKKTSAQMAEAARNCRAGNSGQGTDGESLAQRMVRSMKDLDRSVQEYEKNLSKCESSQKNSGQCSANELSQLSQSCGSCNSQLNNLQKQLKQLSAMRSAQKQLDQLRRMLGQCQGSAAGQCQSPFAGGKKAGMGSSQSENHEATPEGGQTTALQGIKGQGPSQVTVEEADSGSAATSGRRTQRKLNFEHQFESFVEREDVPEVVKGGVKNYFESIHPEAQATP